MLKQKIQKFKLDPDRIRKKQNLVYQGVLANTSHIDQPNFSRIHARDLECIFDNYDRLFFDCACREHLKRIGLPLTFRLSSRMTRAGGKTTRHEVISGRKSVATSFEIAVSTTLLFETFREGQPKARVAGLPCDNRLQAMMRIVEHEIIHLIEMLVWWDSNCFGPRFKRISNRIFEHRESNHQLITPDERARDEFGIRAGDLVAFQHEGKTFSGYVNRITRRATVLVENPVGESYNDGKRYIKFYVPIANLRRIKPKFKTA